MNLLQKKDNNQQLFVTKRKKITYTCAKKYEFIGRLKWGYNRKKMCKNTYVVLIF